MAKSKSSRRWLAEHFDDQYVKKAQQQGLRSRAAFKLIELDEKYGLLRKGMRVVAAPEALADAAAAAGPCRASNANPSWRARRQPLPAIAASAMLIFPWSFDDFVVTYFVAGIGSTTLPIYVFSQLRFGATPVINTIGTLFVVLTMAALVLMYFVQKKNENI